MGSNSPPGGDPLGYLSQIVPGFGAIEAVASFLNSLTDDLAKIGPVITSGQISGFYNNLHHMIDKADSLLGLVTNFTWESLTELSVGELYTGMLQLGLGVDTTQFDDQAQQGIKTTDTMLGFAFILPYVCTGLSAILHAALGHRAPEGLAETLNKLPEEMGLTWALGMQIEGAYEAAVGESVKEAIKKQKRPTRPEWPILRMMVKQHIIDNDKLREHLEFMGYKDDFIGDVIGLNDAHLQPSELQRLHQYGLIGGKYFHDQLEALGYGPTNRDLLYSLYVEQMQTSASVTYRTVARNLFLNHLIDESHYREILTATKTPSDEISDDIAAINLEHEAGRINVSLSTLKTEYVKGNAPPGVVQLELSRLGYTSLAIQETLKAWDIDKAPKRLPVSKLLSYVASGIWTDLGEAKNIIISHGIRPDDAQFLIDHPTAAGGHVHKLTPALVTQAYLDGVLAPDQLADALKRAGLEGDGLDYAEGVAKYKKAHSRKSQDGTKVLSEGTILKCFKYGLFDQQEATNRLVDLGYSSGDALLILEAENKGPFTAPSAPLFANLGQAIAFLKSRGYTVKAPQDPREVAAEQMLWANGYSAIPPYGSTPSPDSGLTGGGMPSGQGSDGGLTGGSMRSGGGPFPTS